MWLACLSDSLRSVGDLYQIVDAPSDEDVRMLVESARGESRTKKSSPGVNVGFTHT